MVILFGSDSTNIVLYPNLQMEQYTLSHVLDLWRASVTSKNVGANFEKYLSIALRLYVLPELDSKAKKLTITEFAAFCDELSVAKLDNALSIFDRRFNAAVERSETSRSTGKNYRSALRKFLEWMKKQAWWRCLFSDSTMIIAPRRVRIPKKPGTGGELSLYGLSSDDLPEQLLIEIEEFKQFRLSGGKSVHQSVREQRRHRQEGEARRPKVKAVTLSTFKSNHERLLRFLGWYVEHHLLSKPHLDLLTYVNCHLQSELHWQLLTNYKQQLLSDAYLECLFEFRRNLLIELHLELLTDINLLDEYVYWAIEKRGVSYSTGKNIAETAIAIAQWLNYNKSTRNNWSDIPLILNLKDLRNEYAEDYAQEKKQRQAEKWALKELSHEEARQVVEYLRSCCAPYVMLSSGKTEETDKHLQKKSTSDIARMWQTYLFVKILVYCPVRQEEIRNYILGETLFRREDEEGNPYYEAYFKNHKRAATSPDRNYRLPAILTDDLDMWVYKWRPLLKESIQTSEGWMKLWGHSPEKIEGFRHRIAAAREGFISKRVKFSPEEYIQEQERVLSGIERRLAGWETAKNNLENHNHLFFMFGKRGIEAFGRPFSIDNFWEVFRRAIANATQALFGEARWTNPHALRHIAEKHIRQPGKVNITEPFGTLIGHSKKMGDEYAEQITSEYDLTEEITDNWWIEDI